ncbi:hypothetical protein [Streptococcus mutans]|uniref:hypothetical protein n=1 Tax=Streptococcus mutans TaxID=1309 RepID=UPI0002FCF34E|nr:hypothetical protein [Streptococcus mutans]
MLKENRNKGFVLYLVFGIFFIIGAVGIFLAVSYKNNSQAVSYNGESTKASSGDKVTLEIRDIYSKPIADIDGHKTVIWLVKYKDNGYVGLESKEEDKDIARLLKAGSSLRQHPKHIAVKYYNTHRSTSHVIRNYSGAMIGILRSQPELNKYFSFYTYVSLYDIKSDQTSLPIVCGLLGLLGLLFIGIAFYVRYKVNRAYDELYAAYPELNGNLDPLISESLYHDDKLKIIIYKNHLITYHRGFALVDLHQVVQLYHRIVKTRRSFIAVNQQSFLVAVKMDNKKVSLFICNRGKKTDEELQPLFAAVTSYFPNIKIGYDKLF